MDSSRYIPWLIIAIMLGLVIRFDGKNYSEMVGLFSGIIAILYVVAIIAIIIVTLVMIVDRYSKNLLGKEGYLMFTLPVTTGEHIWNKTISAALWTLFSYIVGILSFLLIALCSGSEVVNMRRHYWQTLLHWRKNFLGHWDEVVEMQGMEFARMWHLYLSACAATFHNGIIDIDQILMEPVQLLLCFFRQEAMLQIVKRFTFRYHLLSIIIFVHIILTFCRFI